MKSENPQPNDHDAANAHDELLGTLINEYFDRKERGETLSKEQFLSEHPDLADELREHLSGLDLIAKIGSSSAAVPLPGDATMDAKGSSAQIRPSDVPHLPHIDGYEIHKLIGRGGMGVVYKATQISTKRQVALKVLLEGPLASDQSRRRFEREIEVAAQLRHSNIIPIYDSGKSDGRLFYAMAYIRGNSLSDHLSAKRPTIPEKLAIFVKICQAVRHAHMRGVMHRDLKPSNVLVDADGEPHILDFGLAKAGSVIDMNMSVSAQIVGTPAYMSPEQAAGDPSAVDTRTDIYSMGVVLYEMLTGKMPYATNVSMGKILENIANAEPPSPSSIDKKINGELSAIVMKALEKNKDRRYQSLDLFQSDVEKFLAGEPISVKPVTAVYLLKKAIWRHRIVIGSAAAALLLGLGITSIIGHYSKKLKEQQKDNDARTFALAAREKELDEKKDLLDQKKLDFERERAEIERRLAAYKKMLPEGATDLPEIAGQFLSGDAPTKLIGEQLAKTIGEFPSEESDTPRSKMAELGQIDEGMSRKPFDLGIPETKVVTNTPSKQKSDGLSELFSTVFEKVVAPPLNPQPASAPATTSKPADSESTAPTTQPMSMTVFHADAGNAATTQTSPVEEKSPPARNEVVSEG